MSKPWALITPASRGIGLHLARHLLKTTSAPVIATAREDLDGTKQQILRNLDVDKERLEVLKLDVTGPFPFSFSFPFRPLPLISYSNIQSITMLTYF